MLKSNNKIVVTCPLNIKQKHPGFYKSFNGRSGKYISDLLGADGIPTKDLPLVKGTSGSKFSIVDLETAEGQPSDRIYIERNWLKAA